MNISLPSFTIFSNFYEILGSCFYAFNQYIEFSVSPCTENNENNMSNVKPLKLIHTFALVGISNYTILNSTILSVLQFSRLIDILSENFWSWVDKTGIPFVRFSNPQPPSNLGIQFYNNLHELLKHSSGTLWYFIEHLHVYWAKLSLSDTASLLTESHIVIDSSTDECNDHSKITLVQIHSLPAKMNSKLTNIETKNSSLEFCLTEIII